MTAALLILCALAGGAGRALIRAADREGDGGFGSALLGLACYVIAVVSGLGAIFAWVAV